MVPHAQSISGMFPAAQAALGVNAIQVQKQKVEAVVVATPFYKRRDNVSRKIQLRKSMSRSQS